MTDQATLADRWTDQSTDPLSAMPDHLAGLRASRWITDPHGDGPAGWAYIEPACGDAVAVSFRLPSPAERLHGVLRALVDGFTGTLEELREQVLDELDDVEDAGWVTLSATDAAAFGGDLVRVAGVAQASAVFDR